MRNVIVSCLGVIALVFPISTGCDSVVIPGPFPVRIGYGYGRETSTAFSPGDRRLGIGPSLVTLFNDASGASPFGYATTVDGVRWQYCNAVPVRGSSCTPVPMAPSQAKWRGDPALAAAADSSRIVVAVTLGQSSSAAASDTSDMIVAAISLDGGHSFANTVQVNKGCGGGDEDQPAATFDPDDPSHIVWVVWRSRGAVFYGICVRGGTIGTSSAGLPIINWFDAAHSVQLSDGPQLQDIGSVFVRAGLSRAGDEAVTIVWGDADNASALFDPCGFGGSFRWTSASAHRDASGVWNWGSRHNFGDTNRWAWCAGTPPGGRVHSAHLNEWRNYGFARMPRTPDSSCVADPADPKDRALWVAVQASPTLFQTYYSLDTGESWIKDQGIGTIGRDGLMPSMDADAAGRLGLFFVSADSSQSAFGPAFAGNSTGLPGAWSPATWLIPDDPTFPVPSETAPASRAMGDYQSVAGMRDGAFPGIPGTFAPVWTSLSINEYSPVIETEIVSVAHP